MGIALTSNNSINTYGPKHINQKYAKNKSKIKSKIRSKTT